MHKTLVHIFYFFLAGTYEEAKSHIDDARVLSDLEGKRKKRAPPQKSPKLPSPPPFKLGIATGSVHSPRVDQGTDFGESLSQHVSLNANVDPSTSIHSSAALEGPQQPASFMCYGGTINPEALLVEDTNVNIGCANCAGR